MAQTARGTRAPGPQGRVLWRSTRRLRQQPLAEFLALQAQFGDVVRLPLWPYPVYLLSHPEALQYVLRDHASNYRKGVLFQSITALQGQGLLTSAGELWRHQRLLAQPAFRPQHLASLGTIMVQEARAVVEGWRHAADTGEPLNVVAWMHRLTFRIVGRALLGIAPPALDPIGRQLQALSRQLFPALAGPLTRTWRLPVWFPIPHCRRFRRAVADYNALAQQVIDARRQAMRHTATPTDLLAMLIAAHDNAAGEDRSAQLLRDAVITFLGAGVETSAQALSWTWYLLALHPTVTRQLWVELETVLGARPPAPADLRHLPYSRMVLDEAMRLYPPAAILPRQANADDTIAGYAVPRNAVVLLSPYVTHRHPEFWPDPEQFCPQRFAPEPVAARHRGAYVPFGDGLRQCIGKPFALLEMHLALATIAQAYALQLVAGRPVVPRLATTLQPGHGLWMTLHRRSA